VEKRLSELKTGKAGVIQNFTDEAIKLKLMEMGCIPGETVWVERVAPLGDPIAITVAGYLLSIRKKEAEAVIISTI
jgi:ferrous iron transport protein A